MSHREEPRSGRGCFGAVVVVPFLALSGMFALIALTGSPEESPLAAPPPARPSSQWWTEPFETGAALSTVTETVVAQGSAREVRVTRSVIRTSGSVATVTVTVPATPARPAATGRNEPVAEEPEGQPGPSTSESPVVTSAPSSTVEPPPPAEPPVAEPPSAVPPVASTPRAEEPVPPVAEPAEPPCDRAEPTGAEVPPSA
ncbi:hypothetical protein [Lentzea xinjiangensis]|nr:hypothetical protein [Lentzea xinjiangensis]